MGDLIVTFSNAVADAPCGLCSRPAAWGPGPQVCLGDARAVVCRDCSRRHAPALVALVHLIRVAERVGRISRHAPWVPLESLLDLARAAEAYATAAPEKNAA